MAEFSFPFTENTGGDDGPYSATFYQEMTSSLFGQDFNGRENASILEGTGNGLNDPLWVSETSPRSNSVEVKIGKALVNGFYYINDSDLNIEIPPNVDGSGYDRIDYIVLEVTFADNTVRCVNVEGVPSVSPVAPTLLKNSVVYQVPLAKINVSNIFIVITNSDIDNSVVQKGIVWKVTQGGTGITDGIGAGDAIRGNGVDSLAVVNAKNISGSIIVEQAGTLPLAIDKRLTRVYDFVSVYNSFSTIHGLDTQNDPANNLRAPVSGSRFYPRAGRYKLNYTVMIYNYTGTTQSNEMYLYNAATASSLFDINGTSCRGPSQVLPSGAYLQQWMMNEVQFNGTEAIELRTTALLYYAPSGTLTGQAQVFIERMA